MYNTRYSCQIVMTFEFSVRIFEKNLKNQITAPPVLLPLSSY